MSILLFVINGSHGETARSMSAFVEGELTGYRRWRVARHLARCKKCQALYPSFLSTLDSLRGIGRQEPPADPDFSARLLKRLRGESRDDPAEYRFVQAGRFDYWAITRPAVRPLTGGLGATSAVCTAGRRRRRPGRPPGRR